MKKILIIQSKINKYTETLRDFILEKYGNDHTVTLGTFDDLVFHISDTPQLLFKWEPFDFDLVYFRKWNLQSILSTPMTLILDHFKIRYVDHIMSHGRFNGKLYQMTLFNLNNIRIPETICIPKKMYLEQPQTSFAYLKKHLGDQIIMKEVSSAKGENNYLITTNDEISPILERAKYDQEFIFQKYIPNSFDYRLLTLQHNVKVVYKRIRTNNTTSHLNNISEGAASEAVDPQSIPELVEIAEKVTHLLSIEVGGVDIMPSDEDGEHYVLEANTSPGLKGPGVLGALSQFLISLVDNNESTS